MRYVQEALKQYEFSKLYEFNTQPNMVFCYSFILEEQKDYVGAFTKNIEINTREQERKMKGICVRELELDEVIALEKDIYKLYHYVAQHALLILFFF